MTGQCHIEEGALVIPHAGLVWSGRPVPQVPHRVMKVYRYPDASWDVLVVQPEHVLVALSEPGSPPIDPSHGICLGTDDVDLAGDAQ